MNDQVDQMLPSHEAKLEALKLAEELLKNIELNEMPLASLALKTSRLARLLNDFKYQEIMKYEASGYPTTSSGVDPEIWKLAVIAGRKYEKNNPTTNLAQESIHLESIGQLEETIQACKLAFGAAQDPDVSISSANPHQYLSAPIGNAFERATLQNSIVKAANHLAKTRHFIYQYTLERFCELKFSTLAYDVFTNARQRVDQLIGRTIPESTQKLASVYENLVSKNPEDWSNAVHSCRRILQNLADALFPPQEPIEKDVNGKRQTINLEKENYINRLYNL